MKQSDIATLIAGIARRLIPGWKVTWGWVDAKDIDGSLARCVSNPERSQVAVALQWPWPESESIEETIWHELTHAALSPITHQIKESDASVMIEEPIVERLSVLLASVPIGMARVMSRAIKELPARLRARVTVKTAALRHGRNRMDAKAVLAAITGQDEGAALKILEEWAAEQLAGAAPAKEPDGDEGAPLAKDPTPGEDIGAGADMGAADRGGVYRGKARSGGLTAAEVARSRKTLASIERDGVASLVARERTAGVELPAEVEKEIMACPTREDAERMMRIAKMSSGASRARSGATGSIAGADARGGNVAPPVTDEILRAEGFDSAWIAQYKAAHANDPDGAAIFLKGGRDRKAAPGNAWTRKTPVNGGN